MQNPLAPPTWLVFAVTLPSASLRGGNASQPRSSLCVSSLPTLPTRSVSSKTIKLYMAGTRFTHIENSLPDPFQDAPLLHLLLRGIKHSVGQSSRHHLPVTMALLRQVKAELAGAADILPSDKLLLWSAFTLAFYGFLHSSEFTSPSTTQFNPSVHLCCNDVSVTSDGCISLHLKSSKTDPYHQGCILLIAPSHCSVCAVRALRKYLSPFSQWLFSSLPVQLSALPHSS